MHKLSYTLKILINDFWIYIKIQYFLKSTTNNKLVKLKVEFRQREYEKNIKTLAEYKI